MKMYAPYISPPNDPEDAELKQPTMVIMVIVNLAGKVEYLGCWGEPSASVIMENV